MTHYVGIIGSRRRNEHEDYLQVVDLVRNLYMEYGTDLVIVSGACPKGADDHAKRVCTLRSIPIVEFPAIMSNVHDRNIYREAYYTRNQSIADLSNEVYAQVAEDRKGGTEDTIKRTIAQNKTVHYLLDSKIKTLGDFTE